MRMRFLAAIFIVVAFQECVAAVVKRPVIVPRFSGAEIGEWTMDHDTALAKARAGTNNVVVMFTGAWWCPHCQALESTVLTQSAWQEYAVSNRLYLVMMDFPGRADQYWCWLRETNYLDSVGLSLEQGEAEIANRYAIQTSYATPGAPTNTVKGISYLRVGYPTLIVLRPDGSRLGRFTPLATTVSMDMVVRTINQLLGADAADETDNDDQGATVLPAPTCEDEEFAGGMNTLGEADAADWYAFDAPAGVQWAFAFRQTEAVPAAEIKAQIFSHPSDTESVAERTMVPSDLSVLSFIVPQTGRYWMKVSRTAMLTNQIGYALSYWYGTAPADVMFAASQVTVSELAPSVTMTVNITGAADDADVRVSFETVAGSAQSGQDYVHTFGELAWGKGKKSAKTITIPLLPDSVWEGDETFRVALYAVRNCEIGAQLSVCTVVLQEQAVRRPGRLGFEGTGSAILKEGSEAFFSVARTAGADGVVSARVEHVQGHLRKTVAQLVWADRETAAKIFAFAFTNEPGFQMDRSSALWLTPLGGATLVSFARGKVALIRRDGVVVQTFAEYTAEPVNQAFGFKASRGFWFYGFCEDIQTPSNWLRCAPVKANDYALLTAAVSGPGVLFFDWRLAGQDATMQCLIGNVVMETWEGRKETSGITVAVPSGYQKVSWKVKRGKETGTEEVFGAVRGFVWEPSPQAEEPHPMDKAVVVNRSVDVSWRDVLAAVNFPSGVECGYEVYAGDSARVLTQLAELTGTGFPRSGNDGDRTAFDNRIERASAKPIYWRVDTVLTDAAGRRAVNTGKVWSMTVLPDGSPEFVASEGGYDPGVAGSVTLPETTVGVLAEWGPFAVAAQAGDTVRVLVKNGALPVGMKAEVRDGAIWITGVPGRVSTGSADLHLSVKRAVGLKFVTIAGSSVKVLWSVRPLGRAAGQFNGYRVKDDRPACGNASLNVTERGKISGKFVSEGLTYTFSEKAFGGFTNAAYFVKAVAKAGTNRSDVLVRVTANGEEATISPDDNGDEADGYILWRNNWKDDDRVALMNGYTGYYTVALPVIVSSSVNAPQGTGYLTLTVKKDGTVIYAGKMADGKNVSGSSTLFYGEDCCSAEDRLTFYVLSEPTGYGKPGHIFGLFHVLPGVDTLPNDNTVESADQQGVQWVNSSPKSVYGYNVTTGVSLDGSKGFTNILDVTGGFYDKTVNLQTCYGAETLVIGSAFVVPIDFDGAQGGSIYKVLSVPDPLRLPAVASSVSTLTFPKRLLVMNGGLVDVDQSVNPWDISLTPNRKSGLFSGSFKVFYQGEKESGQTLQKTRTFSLKGVFLPVRNGYQSYSDWMGFYLVSDAYRYLDASGRQKSYGFNWSYDFLLSGK